MLSQAQVSQLLSLLPVPTFLLNAQGACLQRFGPQAASDCVDAFLPQDTIAKVYRAEKAQWLISQLQAALAANAPLEVEFSISQHDRLQPHPDSSDKRWFSANLQALDFSVHGENLVLLMLHDISHYQQQVQKWAFYDEVDLLSHLYSQRRMSKELSAHFSLYHRHHAPCSLVLFELDCFDELQQQCGHNLSDNIIELVGKICVSAIRQEDRAFRYHHNGFVILMPHTDTEHAWGLIDRLRKALHLQLLEMDLPQACTSISGGLSQFHHNDQRYMEVLNRADTGLLHAKELGRNRICLEHLH
ncbi:hypothetical protein HR45_10580 [Shewanella mangrovi]|uniref:diguanylate cyclase n=1 Tax=Shewanella mangrovi TaxID=1515746 RepID=A0A094LQK5_9GAMM|nr:GGDEF domain-containing protein [Shewanella mangrovi]KFZ37453.1 hypothetical protein HR45_10580 [Shewanella mangrovi]